MAANIVVIETVAGRDVDESSPRTALDKIIAREKLSGAIANETGLNTSALGTPFENRLESKYGMSSTDDGFIAAIFPLIRHDLDLYLRAKELLKRKDS